jgi:hypothetical protein
MIGARKSIPQGIALGQDMIFVYLRDGRRVDVEEAVAFAHRGHSLICLDANDEEVRLFDAREVTAYGHVAYPYDPEFAFTPLGPEDAMADRIRRRRRRRAVSA